MIGMLNETFIGIGLHHPPGTYPGYNETHEHQILVLMVVTIVLILPALGLRLYTRARIVRFLGWDDWLITLASLGIVGFAIFCAFTGISDSYATGLHIQYVNSTQAKNFYFSVWLYEPGYAASLATVKCGILAYYMRLQFKAVFLITLIVVILANGSLALAFVFQCIPIYHAWDVHHVGGPMCIDIEAMVYTSSAFNIATDFWIWGLAVNMFQALKIPRRQKLVVLGIFSVGIIACVSSLVRLYTIKVYFNSKDPTWDSFAIVVWSFLELGLGILAANIPTIKPLAMRWFQRFYGDEERMRAGEGNSTMRTLSRAPVYLLTLSHALPQRKRLGTSRIFSRISSLFSNNTTAVGTTTNNTMASAGVGDPQSYPEAPDWHLAENDFCADPRRRHEIPIIPEKRASRRLHPDQISDESSSYLRGTIESVKLVVDGRERQQLPLPKGVTGCAEMA